jgi:hypothetical protein
MQVEKIDQNPFGLSQGETAPKLPSRYQLGDDVVLDFNDAGRVKNGKVIKVHFTESKVLYDVEILSHYQTLSGQYGEEVYRSRLYNVDSCNVFSALQMEPELKERIEQRGSIQEKCPDCGADLEVNLRTGAIKFIKHNT